MGRRWLTWTPESPFRYVPAAPRFTGVKAGDASNFSIGSPVTGSVPTVVVGIASVDAPEVTSSGCTPPAASLDAGCGTAPIDHIGMPYSVNAAIAFSS